MDAIFRRKKTSLALILLLLSGIALIALYVFLNVADDQDASGSFSFLLMGILMCLVVIPSMLFNHGAFIRIEENAIHAKYHWFGRLDCTMDEVAFANAQINTLTILLKNGKRHTIMGVENTWLLSSAIRRHNFKLETEEPEALRQKIAQMQIKRKKELLWVLGGIVLMFSNIFIAVLLTGGKEMRAFGKMDWVAFVAMGFIELLTLVGTLYFARRCGKQLLPIEQVKYQLCGAIIATHPLPTNIVKNVYTDENYTGRIVVCGFPNDESVYCCVQKFEGSFDFETVYTTEIYSTLSEIPGEGFAELIDVTSQILPQ